jgi:hypothetical protein
MRSGEMTLIIDVGVDAVAKSETSIVLLPRKSGEKWTVRTSLGALS